MRTANPKQWHKELRKLTNFGSDSSEKIVVDEIKNLSKAEQAEVIADKFAEVSCEYDPLDMSKVEVPRFNKEDIPKFTEQEVLEVLQSLDTSKSTRCSDIPSVVLK